MKYHFKAIGYVLFVKVDWSKAGIEHIIDEIRSNACNLDSIGLEYDFKMIDDPTGNDYTFYIKFKSNEDVSKAILIWKDL